MSFIINQFSFAIHLLNFLFFIRFSLLCNFSVMQKTPFVPCKYHDVNWSHAEYISLMIHPKYINTEAKLVFQIQCFKRINIVSLTHSTLPLPLIYIFSTLFPLCFGVPFIRLHFPFPHCWISPLPLPFSSLFPPLSPISFTCSFFSPFLHYYLISCVSPLPLLPYTLFPASQSFSLSLSPTPLPATPSPLLGPLPSLLPRPHSRFTRKQTNKFFTCFIDKSASLVISYHLRLLCYLFPELFGCLIDLSDNYICMFFIYLFTMTTCKVTNMLAIYQVIHKCIYIYIHIFGYL